MAITREAAINRYIGLSTDTKPTGAPIGATYWEYDTKNIYKTYDGTNWALYDSLASMVSGTFLSSAATTTTITAAALADVAGQYVGQTVLPLEGAMSGEARYITAYNGTNQLTVSPAWAADPDAGGAIHFMVLAGSNSIVVAALGTNGTTVTDSATTVLGAIGANNNNNAFDSTNVVANADGSVLERDEYSTGQIALVKAQTDKIATGLALPLSKTIDLNQAAGSYDLYTGETQAVLLESLVIRMSGGAVGGAVTYISIQTNDATPQVIINSAIGAVANLTNEAQLTWHASFGGPIYIKVGQKIQLTIGGGAAGVAKVCDVVAEYKPVVAGGVLA